MIRINKADTPKKRSGSSKKGFTLFETMLALFIMVLFTLLLTRAMETATTTYTGVVNNTNADMLLSNTVTCLRNELVAAKNVTVSEGNVIKYNDGATGAECTISNSPQKGIQLDKYKKSASLCAATDGLISSYGEVVVSNGTITIRNIRITKDGVQYAALTEFVISNY